MKKAIIGLDGLDPSDLNRFDGDWHELDIVTTVHTCPSWNAIFNGKEREGVYDFWVTPDDDVSGMLARKSDVSYTYEDLKNGRYLWEKYDVDVVSAPIILPMYSTVWEEPPNSYGWPSTRDEITDAIDNLGKETVGLDRVITVFPVPDKCNHLVNSGSNSYSTEDRDFHLDLLKFWMGEIIERFDEYVFLSDHGLPTRREYVTEDLWVPSHEPTGVVTSNAYDVSGHTNVSIYQVLSELLK